MTTDTPPLIEPLTRREEEVLERSSRHRREPDAGAGAIIPLGLAVVAAAMLLLVACKDDNSRNPNVLSDADARSVLNDALNLMAGAESYKASYELDIDDPDEALLGVRWTIEYQSLDSFHYMIVSETDGGSEVLEVILIDDLGYARGCADVDTDCGEWEAGPRPEIPTFALSTLFVHGWPLLALQDATDLNLDQGGGTVTGETRLDRAVTLNIRRLAEETGLADRVRACAAAATEIAEGDDVSLPTPRDDGLPCGESGYDDLFGEEADAALERTDIAVAPFVTTISPEGYVARIEFPSGGATDPVGRGSTMTIEYSNFNDVTIEVPEEFR